MEWSIKPSSKQCFVSGKVFSGGDEIVCLVCQGVNNEVVRFDILKEFAPDFIPEGKIIGQWTKILVEGESKKADFEQKVAYQEEFFFSLYDGEENKEKDILKQLFAFLLEKKRILRSLGRKNDEKQKFIHIKSKREFIVPMKDFLPEDLTSLENVFGMFT